MALSPAKSFIVIGDSGRIIFGTCSCAFFQDNLLGRGPCEHMIALFKASAESRKDLPTSTRVAAVPAPTPASKGSEEEQSVEQEEAGEEDFDEDESDDNNEDK